MKNLKIYNEKNQTFKLMEMDGIDDKIPKDNEEFYEMLMKYIDMPYMKEVMYQARIRRLEYILTEYKEYKERKEL